MSLKRYPIIHQVARASLYTYAYTFSTFFLHRFTRFCHYAFVFV